jgi:hypothetical protein
MEGSTKEDMDTNKSDKLTVVREQLRCDCTGLGLACWGIQEWHNHASKRGKVSENVVWVGVGYLIKFQRIEAILFQVAIVPAAAARHSSHDKIISCGSCYCMLWLI